MTGQGSDVEVVVAHQERATLRVGDVFLKIDADQARTDVEVEAMAVAPVPTAEILWPRPPVLALAALQLNSGPGDEGPGGESRESRTVRDMLERTRQLWEKQDQHVGDRQRLFTAVAESIDVTTVLYPGSYVDLAPSFVWLSVTYVDVDRRANSFFGDVGGIEQLLVEHGADAGHEVQFIHADYQDPLDLDEEAFDLLISLYAGFVSEHCTHHLRRGGFLLVIPSHGDAAMASIDRRYELWAVVTSRSGRYSVRRDDLDSYLVPKRDVDVTKELLHSSGRGVGYTKSPFAYLFRRID